ncbi:MAG: pyridoxamine 5'-phosphate oxidase family protein [Gammaproteobacteria bacterium]|nr:pyridoxamine 5'-phosphate oxidase family protein [Gammaproteobacteria bacterium]
MVKVDHDHSPSGAIPKNKHPLIASTKFGVMSTIRHSDGMISSNPVGYFWDGEIIRISTLKSRVKYQNLLADSRVALCIVNAGNVMDHIEIAATPRWRMIRNVIFSDVNSWQAAAVSNHPRISTRREPNA